MDEHTIPGPRESESVLAQVSSFQTEKVREGGRVRPSLRYLSPDERLKSRRRHIDPKLVILFSREELLPNFRNILRIPSEEFDDRLLFSCQRFVPDGSSHKLPSALPFGISNSEFLAASVASVPALSAILASPIWGTLKDRSSRSKPLMLVGLLPYAALSFFLAFTRDVTQIFLAWSAAALLFAATTPVFASFVTAGVERRGTSLGLMAASSASGVPLGLWWVE